MINPGTQAEVLCKEGQDTSHNAVCVCPRHSFHQSKKNPPAICPLQGVGDACFPVGIWHTCPFSALLQPSVRIMLLRVFSKYFKLPWVTCCRFSHFNGMVSNIASNMYLLTWSLKEWLLVIDSCVCVGNSPLILRASGSSTPYSKPAKPQPPPTSSFLLPPCLCPSDAYLLDGLLLAGLMAGQTQGFMFLPIAGAEFFQAAPNWTKLTNPWIFLMKSDQTISLVLSSSTGLPVWVILHSSPQDT